LTNAGSAFVEEARRSLAHAEKAVRAARAFQRPGQKEVTIGYSPRINFRLLTIIRDLARAQIPALRISFVSAHVPDQVEALRERRVEIGIVTLPVQQEEIAKQVLIREPLTVALHLAHPLSAKSHLKVRELTSVPIISLPRHFHPEFHDHLLRLFKKEGFTPNLTQVVTTEAEALFMVSEGLGAAIVHPTLASLVRPEIVFRRFRESSLVQETAIAYRREQTGESVRQLVSLIRKTVARMRPDSLGLLEIGSQNDPRQLRLF
jgi:DNA-binding transcriptional LysR family regulator